MVAPAGNTGVHRVPGFEGTSRNRHDIAGPWHGRKPTRGQHAVSFRLSARLTWDILVAVFLLSNVWTVAVALIWR